MDNGAPGPDRTDSWQPAVYTGKHARNLETLRKPHSCQTPDPADHTKGTKVRTIPGSEPEKAPNRPSLGTDWINQKNHLPERRDKPPSLDTAHLSFWTGRRVGCPRRSMPALIVPESVQTQEDFVPAGLQKLPVRLNRHGYCGQATSTAACPAVRSAAARSNRPSAAGAPANRPPLRAHRFAARNRPPPARAPSAPVSNRGNRSPQEGRSPPRPAPHSGSKPPQSMRCRDFEGTSEVAKRLPPKSSVAGREPKSTAESVGSPRTGATHFVNNPPHSRDFAGQSCGNVEGSCFRWGFLSWALKKRNAPAQAACRKWWPAGPKAKVKTRKCCMSITTTARINCCSSLELHAVSVGGFGSQPALRRAR